MTGLAKEPTPNGFDALDTSWSLLSDQACYELWLTWGPPDLPKECSRPRTSGLRGPDGQPLTKRCKTNSCIFCNRVLTLDMHRTVAWAGVDYMVGISGLPEYWPSTRDALTQLRRYLKRDGYNIVMAHGVEPNPRHTGFHLHALVRGDRVPQRRLQERAWQVGLGRVHIESVTYAGNFAYAVKLATWNTETLAAYRDANGAHLLHPTKGFWRDPSTGESLSRSEAAARARRESPRAVAR